MLYDTSGSPNSLIIQKECIAEQDWHRVKQWAAVDPEASFMEAVKEKYMLTKKDNWLRLPSHSPTTTAAHYNLIHLQDKKKLSKGSFFEDPSPSEGSQQAAFTRYS